MRLQKRLDILYHILYFILNVIVAALKMGMGEGITPHVHARVSS